MDISTETINRAQSGDIHAFEDLYKKASGFVYNVALSVTNNKSDADEITQDVFIKIYKNIGKFRSLSSIKTWIYRIAVNTAINHKKASQKHTENREDPETAFRSIAAKERVRDNVAKKDAKERISKLLTILNPDQRACILLREIEGLDYKEIANVLGVNINTVRTRLKRARRKLILAAYAKKG